MTRGFTIYTANASGKKTEAFAICPDEGLLADILKIWAEFTESYFEAKRKRRNCISVGIAQENIWDFWQKVVSRQPLAIHHDFPNRLEINDQYKVPKTLTIIEPENNF